MKVRIGKEAYDFTANAIMPDGSIGKVSLKEHIKGKNCMLFFYPLNFTFVCPSELVALNSLHNEFLARETQVSTISVDSHFSHIHYREYLKNYASCNINYTMISDLDKSISESYGVLGNNCNYMEDRGDVSLRGVYIIDKNFILRHMLINDFPIGRNVEDSIRVLDAILHHEKYGEVCPAGWSKGKKAMTPSQEGVKDFLSKM